MSARGPAHRGVLALALCAGLAPFTEAVTLTPKERRGKQLYLRGVSDGDAEARAYLRGADMEVPASVMACANCHGRDGRGRPEGGVAPPDITWAQLTRRASHSHAGDRVHAPYTAATLAPAIARGVDPDGHVLEASMPIYRLSPAALDALVAYVQRLGGERDPGLEPGRLVLGTLAPAGHAPARQAQAAWRALLDEVNASGGVHGRRLELRSVEYGPGAGEQLAALRGLLGDEGVFALLGAFLSEPADDVLALVEEHEAPFVAPFTLFPRLRTPPDRHVFYVVSGVAEQARAVVRHLREQAGLARPRLALLWPDEPGYAAAAAEVAAACEQAGLPVVLRHGASRAALADGATKARAAGAEAVLLLGARGEELAFARAAAGAGWHPYLLLPGYMGGAGVLELPVVFEGRALVGLPLPPPDLARMDEATLRLLAAPAGAGATQAPGAARVHAGPVALGALRGARVLIEGLRRAGRELSREGLVEALEGLYDLETGFGPKVVFGPNRHSASPGAHIVGVDLERRRFVPVSDWTAAE